MPQIALGLRIHALLLCFLAMPIHKAAEQKVAQDAG